MWCDATFQHMCPTNRITIKILSSVLFVVSVIFAAIESSFRNCSRSHMLTQPPDVSFDFAQCRVNWRPSLSCPQTASSTIHALISTNVLILWHRYDSKDLSFSELALQICHWSWRSEITWFGRFVLTSENFEGLPRHVSSQTFVILYSEWVNRKTVMVDYSYHGPIGYWPRPQPPRGVPRWILARCDWKCD